MKKITTDTLCVGALFGGGKFLVGFWGKARRQKIDVSFLTPHATMQEPCHGTTFEKA